MGILKSNRKGKQVRDLRQSSLLMMVPAILISGPLVGLFGGQWLDKKFETEPIFLIIGIALGFASAGLETYKLIKKAEALEDAEKFKKEKNDTK